MIPEAEESIKFWNEFWDNPADHDRNTELIITVEKELECVAQQSNISITKEDVSIHIRKMPNWKAPGPEGLPGFWQKNFTSLN